MSNNNNNIQIAMLELSDQNKAILDFYFSSTGQSLYTVVGEDQADVLIMDYDYPTVKDHLAKIKATSKKPVILLSINEQSIPATVWLAKPLTAQALTDAAEKLKKLLLEPEETNEVSESITELEEELSTTEEILSEEVNTEDEEIIVDKESLSFSQTLCDSENKVNILKDVQKNLHENILKVRSVVAKPASLATSLVNVNEASQFESEELSETDNEESLLEADDNDHHDDSDTTNTEMFDPVSSDLGKNVELEEMIVAGQQPLSEDDTEKVDELEVEALLDSLMNDEGISSDFIDSSDDISDQSYDEVVYKNTLEDQPEVDENLDLEAKVSATYVLGTETTGSLFKKLTLETETDPTTKEKTTLKTNTESTEKFKDESLSEITLEEKSISSIEEESKNTLIEDSFTFHNEVDASTEDTFASTLEFDYKKSKDTNIDKTLDTDLNDSFEELQSINLAVSEQIKQEVAENMISLNEQYEQTEKKLDFSNLSSLKTDTDLDDLLEEVTQNVDFNMLEQASEPNTTSNLVNDLNENLDVIDVLDNPDETTVEDNDLQSLLNEVRDEANKNPNGESLGLDDDSSPNQTYKKTKAENRWIQLCGDLDEINNQKEVASISYNLSDHLQNVFLTQIKAGVNSEHASRIKYRDLFIVLDHTRDKVYCDFSLTDDRFAALSVLELNPDDLKIHVLDSSEIKAYRLKAEQNPNRAHSFESFIWSTSLLTSKGRLQAGTQINKQVGLKAWPNLTRMELMPHAMQIAAVFSKQPGSLLEMPKWIDIDQRYVFAFYNAALALDMIETDAAKLKKIALSFKNKGVEENIAEERGFFGRLLKRLKS